MDPTIFFGGSLIAAMIAGTVALLAPCCISAMLPAYFASAFQNRRMLVAMTFLFAAGVATVILPIALGAAAVQRFLLGQHSVFYVLAGVLLLALATYVVLGGKVSLPMPGRRATRTGPLGVYGLGVFSGAASSCCAPVLVGVIALSGLASSFGAALGLGLAYVFGMVAPLFVLSLLWERYDWRSSRLFRPRSFTWRLGPVRKTVTGTAVATGALLAAMGVGTIVVGLTSDAMPAASGWQADVSSELQHYGRIVTDALSWIPGWATALLLIAAVAILARRAWSELLGPSEPDRPADPDSAQHAEREVRENV